MKPMTCATARRRVQAFHDGELSLADQVAVQSHLDWCDVCGDWLADVRAIGAVVRHDGLTRGVLSYEEAGAFVAAVVSRSKAEEDASLFAQVRRMFDDLHLVYAGVGAAVATAACIVVMLGMMRFAPTEHPDASPSASLAAIVSLLTMPGSANAIAVDPASHARGTARFQAANETAAEDAVFLVASAVTRGERLINLEHLRTGHKATRAEAKAIDELLQAVARARIDPAADTPVSAGGMVWLVTSMTVRASKTLDGDLQLPPMKTPRVSHADDHSSGVRL